MVHVLLHIRIVSHLRSFVRVTHPPRQSREILPPTFTKDFGDFDPCEYAYHFSSKYIVLLRSSVRAMRALKAEMTIFGLGTIHN